MDRIDPGNVDVWELSLTLDAEILNRGRSILSPDERERADRFHFAQDSRRFTAARLGMRTILSEYLDIGPQSVSFAYSEKGKPELAAAHLQALQFNLSHSHEHALLAVALGNKIGVDIEYIKSEVNADDIASSYFSPHECDILRHLSADQKLEAFYACWTRKEAYAKAKGAGLSLEFKSFDVTFGPHDLPALSRAEDRVDQHLRWCFYNLEAPPQYVAALVVEGSEHHITRRRWIP